MTPEQRDALIGALWRVDAGHVGAQEFRRTVVDEDLIPIVDQLLAEDREKTADDWQQGQWAVLTDAQGNFQTIISSAQIVADWLRERAEQ